MAKSKYSLQILVIPLNGHGHVNACHGLCDELRDRGHRVIFLLDEEFKGRLSKYGFEERFVKSPHEMKVDEKKVEFWQGFVAKFGHKCEEPPEKQIADVLPMVYRTMFEQQKLTLEDHRRIIQEIKPDLIISDGRVHPMAIVDSGIPWIWLHSSAPYYLLQGTSLPPFFSGLPSDGDKNEWKRFNEIAKQSLMTLVDQINDYCSSKGIPRLDNGNTNRLHPISPYLNVLMWPKEMRHKEMEQLPENIIAADCFVRKVSDQTFSLPEKLQNLPGKLILFSMGSFGCSNLKMMRRLVEILSHSPHRFIVSKGPLDYELADNMWGEPFVPQPAILPMVDLVITHGGNNTVTESFYYGKKMLIMPMYCDQIDNAQRITEIGLGAKCNPFNCTQEELLQTIQTLLDNEQLTEKMSKIGQRIRASNDKKRVVDHIENKIQEWKTLKSNY